MSSPPTKIRQLAAPQFSFEKTDSNSSIVLDDDLYEGYYLDAVGHWNYDFDALDEEESIIYDTYVGPTPESNWLIPSRIMVGAFPASEDDNETDELISSLLFSRVSTFVCLQQEYQVHVTEQDWREGRALRPYFKDAKSIAEKFQGTIYADIVCPPTGLRFIHFPIVDCSISDDTYILKLCIDLVRRISQGEILYIHCWGGHGRTGTVVSIMLHLMYGLSALDCMSHCQTTHDLR